MRPQETPDLLLVHVAQFGCNQWPVPAREAARRLPLQDCQNASTGLAGVFRCRSGPRLVGQTGQAFAGEPAAPSGNRTCRAAFVRQQDDPRAKRVALFRRRCPHPRFKHRTILRRQPDLRSYGNHPNVESRVSLP